MKILLFAALLLTSCADPFVYYRRGVAPDEYRADAAECRHEAGRLAPLISDGNALYALRNYCLAERGYTLTDPRTGRPWSRTAVEGELRGQP